MEQASATCVCATDAQAKSELSGQRRLVRDFQLRPGIKNLGLRLVLNPRISADRHQKTRPVRMGHPPV